MQKAIDLSHELIIIRHLDGFRLVRPEKLAKLISYSICGSVSEMLALPYNIFFLDRNSVTLNINEAAASSYGLLSTQDVIGNTVEKFCHKREQFYTLHANDQRVVRLESMLIVDEQTELVNQYFVHAVSFKFPWYDEKNCVIGVFGCAAEVSEEKKMTIANNLASITDKFLLPKIPKIPKKKIRSVSTNTYFSPRELDVIKYLIRCKTMREIAGILHLSQRTVESYVENMKAKMGVQTKSQLIDMVMGYYI